MLGSKVGGFASKQQRSGTDMLTSSNDMGDSNTSYNAIHINDDDDADNGDSAGSVTAPSSRVLSTNGAKVNFEIETRQADGESLSPDEPMSRERRLTLKQLERFRRAMARRSRRGSRAGSRWSNGDKRGDDVEFDDLFGDTGLGCVKELRFTTYPWPYWIFGGLVVIATTVFVERVHANSLGASEQARSQDWWKYIVAFVVYALALGIVANGRVETFLMSKEQNRLLIRSSKPLCLASQLRRERCVDRALSHIVDIRVEASGEFSGEVDTRCYKIHFEFEDGAHATALELRCKKRTLERCRVIKDFLFACVSVSAQTPKSSSGGAMAVAPVPAPVLAPAPVAPSPRKHTLPSVPSSSLPRKNTSAAVPDADKATLVPRKLDTLG